MPVSYYIDEAGDLTLFDKKGRVIVGSDGVSRTFMLGGLRLYEEEVLAQKLEELRQNLLADPYFKNVPSMQLSEGKTARAFHAKDDLPEVRYEVFKLLSKFEAEVVVSVRHKTGLVDKARLLFERGQKLRENDVYDEMITELMVYHQHYEPRIEVVFARRGKAPRAQALQEAINRSMFHEVLPDGSRKPGYEFDVHSAHPWERAGLQVVDYYLWAVQRSYERGETRYYEYLADKFKLIIDWDDPEMAARLKSMFRI